MPEISRFYGIVVKMFHNDHHPPHFHAEYGNDRMIVNIDTLGVIAGSLPPRATGLVMEWAAQHQADLQIRPATCSRSAESLHCLETTVTPRISSQAAWRTRTCSRTGHPW